MTPETPTPTPTVSDWGLCERALGPSGGGVATEFVPKLASRGCGSDDGTTDAGGGDDDVDDDADDDDDDDDDEEGGGCHS